jgi:hypothetical protein
MKRLCLLGISLLAISACTPQPSPQSAYPAQSVAAAPTGAPPAPGSPSNTTRAFDGYYGNSVARNVTPGCLDFVSGRSLTIRGGQAAFQVLGAGGTLNFQGYVNPQGQLTMVSQQGQTVQGQIDSNFVFTARSTSPTTNCVYDATWNRVQAF